MNKILNKSLILTIIGLVCATVVYAKDKNTGAEKKEPYPIVRVKVEGACNSEVCGEGYLINNTSYVPLRFVMEAMGAEVQWDGKTQTATIVRPEDKKSNLENKDHEYISETIKVLEVLEHELNLLVLLEQQFNLASDLYDKYNDKTMLEKISREKILEHQKTINEIAIQLVAYQEKYKEHNENNVKLILLTNEIGKIIDNYKMVANSFQNYFKALSNEDYKQVLLYRAYALDKMEKAISDLKTLKDAIK